MRSEVLGAIVALAVVAGCSPQAGKKSSDDPAKEARDRVVQALGRGEPPSPPQDKPVLRLAYKGADKELRECLATQGDANAKDQWGITALHYAVAKRHVTTAQLLLEEGANVDALAGGDWEISPLRLAVVRNDAEMVALLVSHGASQNANDGFTPLHYAARIGHTRIAELLLNRGANVNACTLNPGFTPLHLAAANGHAAMVELLLRRGAEVNWRTQTYVLKPTSLGEKVLDSVSWRFSRGPGTALGLAKKEGHAEVVRILETHGAKE